MVVRDEELFDRGAGKSSEGESSGLVFSKPADEVELKAPGRAAAGQTSALPLQGIRALIVDDTPDIQRLLWFYLTRAGACVETAVNGLEAVDKAMADTLDVVLMDLQMPLMDGMTATRILRDKGFLGAIVAVTAFASTEAKRMALSAGCDDYLQKPVSRSGLIQSIQRAVVLQRRRRIAQKS